MNNGEVTFRRAVVGGFNREDVMEYISTMATANNEQQKLRIALRESEAKIEKLEADLEAKDNDLAQAAQSTNGEQEKLNEALKESEATIAELRAQLAEKNSKLAQAEAEIETLRNQLGESDEMKQKLEQYESRSSDLDNTADKLMRESMAYAERYVESANLMAGNIRKETLTKVKDADAKVDEMLAKAAEFSKECEKFEDMLNFFKAQLGEIQNTFTK